MKNKIVIMHIAEAAKGVERYLHTLLKKMNKYPEFEHILLVSQDYNIERFEGITKACVCIDSLKHEINPRVDIAAAVAVRKEIRKWKPDIVYCHSTKAGAIGRMANIGIKNKLIYNAHGWAFNMRTAGKVKRGIYLAVEHLLAPLTDKVVCISRYEARCALRKRICHKDRIEFIRSGIDYDESLKTERRNGGYLPEDDASIRSILRKELMIPEDAFVIGAVGRLAEQKAPDIFVRMAERIGKKYPNTYFMLVGDGELREETERAIEHTGISERFRITGWMENPLFYIRCFDLAALFSRWEGFGLVLPEYMLMHKPIVTTDADAIPEVVGDAALVAKVDDVNGLSDETERLLLDPELRARLVRVGNRRVKRYNADLMAGKHAELFLRLMNKEKADENN